VNENNNNPISMLYLILIFVILFCILLTSKNGFHSVAENIYFNVNGIFGDYTNLFILKILFILNYFNWECLLCLEEYINIFIEFIWKGKKFYNDGMKFLNDFLIKSYNSR